MVQEVGVVLHSLSYDCLRDRLPIKLGGAVKSRDDKVDSISETPPKKAAFFSTIPKSGP